MPFYPHPVDLNLVGQWLVLLSLVFSVTSAVEYLWLFIAAVEAKEQRLGALTRAGAAALALPHRHLVDDRAASRGTTNANTLPPPSRERTSTRPPWASATRLTIASPSPVPRAVPE